jgi:hypothetical protein
LDNDLSSKGIDEGLLLSKEEIFRKLNISSGDDTYGKGQFLTRDGITKELCDNITKEIEKLRRQSENIQTRKTLA